MVLQLLEEVAGPKAENAALREETSAPREPTEAQGERHGEGARGQTGGRGLVEQYNAPWIVQKNGYPSPAQARQACDAAMRLGPAA